MNKAGIIKHKVVFDAWLKGEEIQFKTPCASNTNWVDFKSTPEYPDPLWLFDLDYRVKPQKVLKKTTPYRRYIYFNSTQILNYASSSSTVKWLEENKNFVKWLDDDWVQDEYEVEQV